MIMRTEKALSPTVGISIDCVGGFVESWTYN
jgi:hypothetical protein